MDNGAPVFDYTPEGIRALADQVINDFEASVLQEFCSTSAWLNDSAARCKIAPENCKSTFLINGII